MMEYAKTVLWGVSFWKHLFKKELIKIVSWSDSIEMIQLKEYCYDKYYDMHPDVIDEVFYNEPEYIIVDYTGNSLIKNFVGSR